MRYEARLKKLESLYTPQRLISIPRKVKLTYPDGMSGVGHPEPVEDALQRYLDAGGVVPLEGDTLVFVSKYT